MVISEETIKELEARKARLEAEYQNSDAYDMGVQYRSEITQVSAKLAQMRYALACQSNPIEEAPQNGNEN